MIHAIISMIYEMSIPVNIESESDGKGDDVFT